MAKKESSNMRGRDKVKPDEGHGSPGNFGSDGDHGRDKTQQAEGEEDHKSSPVPVKKAK